MVIACPVLSTRWQRLETDWKLIRLYTIIAIEVFTSALPVAYSYSTKLDDWTRFACFVLEVAFDATLAVGRVLSHKRGDARVKVYLTPVGGGAFGNQPLWIVQAIEKALWKHRQAPLDVVLVHYRCLDPQFLTIPPIHLSL
jgi:hypothetical protein